MIEVKIYLDDELTLFLNQHRDDLHDYIGVNEVLFLHPELIKALIAKLQMSLK